MNKTQHEVMTSFLRLQHVACQDGGNLCIFIFVHGVHAGIQQPVSAPGALSAAHCSHRIDYSAEDKGGLPWQHLRSDVHHDTRSASNKGSIKQTLKLLGGRASCVYGASLTHDHSLYEVGSKEEEP